MKYIYQQSWCIGFLLEGEFIRVEVISLRIHTSRIIISLCSGIFCGHMQPSLRPLMYYSCPNETVAYTCHDSQVKIIEWIIEPYVPECDPIIFAASITVYPEGCEPLSHPSRGNNVSGWMADMTTTLIVNTADRDNKTNITCQTQFISFYLPLDSRLYILSYIINHQCV